jgi:hypothetical protein
MFTQRLWTSGSACLADSIRGIPEIRESGHALDASNHPSLSLRVFEVNTSETRRLKYSKKHQQHDTPGSLSLESCAWLNWRTKGERPAHVPDSQMEHFNLIWPLPRFVNPGPK